MTMVQLAIFLNAKGDESVGVALGASTSWLRRAFGLEPLVTYEPKPDGPARISIAHDPGDVSAVLAVLTSVSERTGCALIIRPQAEAASS